MDAEQQGREQSMSRQRLECVELAPALVRLGQPQSASLPRTLSGQAPNAFGAGWTRSKRFASPGAGLLPVRSTSRAAPGMANPARSGLIRPNPTDQTKIFFEPATPRCALRILISIWRRS
jgi:hypothetical protein